MTALIKELWETRSDGRIKLFLIRRLLMLRNNMKELFTEGEYIPLEAIGRHSSSVITFMRRYGGQVAITVAPRFLTAVTREGELPAGSLWEDTKIILPESINPLLKESITGSEFVHSGEILLKNILVSFPGAVITGTLIQDKTDIL